MSNVDVYVTCPFDKSHRILKARFQTHLRNCRRNYPDQKIICPFDATHMLDPQEYEHHISVCTTSGNIRSYEYSLEPKYRVGTIPIEQACSLQAHTLDEDWSGNCPTYDPIVATQNKNIIRSAIGLSKSKKKQFRKQERERIAALENSSHNDNNSSKASSLQKIIDLEQPLRVPKKAAKAMTYSQCSSLDNLTSELDDMSIEESNNLSVKENVSIASNFNHSVSSSKCSSTSGATRKLNTSLSFKGISTEEQKQNLSEKGSNDKTMSQDILKVNETISKERSVAEANDQKVQGNYKGTAVSDNALQKNLSKQQNLEIAKTLTSNPRIAAKFYGEAKKISTGRGFTIAYQNLNASLSKAEERNEISEDLDAAYGYNEE